MKRARSDKHTQEDDNKTKNKNDAFFKPPLRGRFGGGLIIDR